MDGRLKYPGLRVELIGYLKELSDIQHQKERWFSPSSNEIVGISGEIDFLIDSQSLNEDARGAVGLYLHEAEVEAITEFASAFSDVVDDLVDIYDSAGAIAHPRWPEVVRLAQVALALLLKSDGESR